MSYLLEITMVPTPKVHISFLFFIFHGGVGFIKAAALVVCSSISKELLKGQTSWQVATAHWAKVDLSGVIQQKSHSIAYLTPGCPVGS